ncbi:hypothetical protein LRS74_00320 [Streptomyces sp. LX-29]|uniref:hypothetical protein n=1 Tax=Streptomyces sp. LX-29 TaxID=2900152 RepID=UPI00240DE95A|nr:hypothetical protein [Streptomyces sp. LX-29]WFB05629.1 hypothetical protein LRS74_00320 [Streptomyces sp. LX-29]
MPKRRHDHSHHQGDPSQVRRTVTTIATITVLGVGVLSGTAQADHHQPAPPAATTSVPAGESGTAETGGNTFTAQAATIDPKGAPATAPSYAVAESTADKRAKAPNCVEHPWGHLKLGGYSFVGCHDLTQHGGYVRAKVWCSVSKTSPKSAWRTHYGPWQKERTPSFAYCDDNEYLQDWGYKYRK